MFSLCSALADAWYWKQMRLVSLRVMTVLSSAVYKKSLLLSALGRQQYTAGEVVNLIAVDCSKVNKYLRTSLFKEAHTLKMLKQDICDNKLICHSKLCWEDIQGSFSSTFYYSFKIFWFKKFVSVCAANRCTLYMNVENIHTICECMLSIYAWPIRFICVWC